MLTRAVWIAHAVEPRRPHMLGNAARPRCRRSASVALLVGAVTSTFVNGYAKGTQCHDSICRSSPLFASPTGPSGSVPRFGALPRSAVHAAPRWRTERQSRRVGRSSCWRVRDTAVLRGNDGAKREPVVGRQ